MAVSAKSVVGVRAAWKCAECEVMATTCQIAALDSVPDAGVMIILDLPPGWTAKGEATYCPAHKPKGRRAA